VKLTASITAGGLSLTGSGALTAAGRARLDLNAGAGGGSQVATSTITADTIASSTGVGSGGVNLAGTANAINKLGAFAVTGGDFTLVDSSALTVTGATSANNVSLISTSAISEAAGQLIRVRRRHDHAERQRALRVSNPMELKPGTGTLSLTRHDGDVYVDQSCGTF